MPHEEDRLALPAVASGAVRRRHAPFTPRTRKIAAAALLVLIVVIEYRLSTLPMAIDLPERLTAAVGSELVLSGLATDGPILTYSGRLNESADIRFDRARLSADLIGSLRELRVDVSDAEGPISWITGIETASKTVFEVRPVDDALLPSELHLRVLPSVGTTQPQLEIEAHGAPLQVRIGAPFIAEDRAAKSVKTLSVAGRKIELPGAIPLTLVVSKDASFRVRFSAATGAPVPEFVLGSIPVNASEEGGLKVRSVGVRKTSLKEDGYAYFACAVAAGSIAWNGGAGLGHGRCGAVDGFIAASQLRVNGPDLELGLIGTGWAQRDGELVGADPLSRIEQNRVLAGVLLVINLALVAWLAFELFGHKLGRPTATWSGGVFISYRREDSAPQAGRLYDHLSAHFGVDRVFRDVDNIHLGDDFARKIRESLDITDAMLAIIGKGWLDARDSAGCRRLDDPNDFVKTEIATAIERGTWVVPVLVGGATMPREQELPQVLAPLARLNAIDISEARFTLDLTALIAALEQGRAEPDVELGASTLKQ